MTYGVPDSPPPDVPEVLFAVLAGELPDEHAAVARAVTTAAAAAAACHLIASFLRIFRYLSPGVL
jgi:hypothetical protein